MKTVNDICNAIRGCKPLSHDDICTVLAGVAACLKDSGVLSHKCRAIVVDMVDEVFGQIEQDKIDQQAEAAWRGRDDSWMARQDDALMNAYSGFGQAFDALAGLSVRVVAAS